MKNVKNTEKKVKNLRREVTVLKRNLNNLINTLFEDRKVLNFRKLNVKVKKHEIKFNQ